ncbi:uncharacterized protein LOC134585371 [Pelobates fuscus]|uniref:uncharacterized protein LOC134585371 n=1 Tax=Pelobates fuscus TaxID=191477 RepID=UPI002FE4A05E
MAFQVWKLPVLCLLFCYWSSTSTVTGFTNEQLKRVTDYVSQTYSITEEYAYVIKFNKTECDQLTDQNIAGALEKDTVDVITKSLSSESHIYEGTRMVISLHKDLGNYVKEHAAYRLLYPTAGSKKSPLENLMKKSPGAGCAIFFSSKSPCQAYCTKPKRQYKIVQKLRQFNSIKKNINKAFIFKELYNEPNFHVCCPEKRLKAIDKKMPLYRCDDDCFLCFPNGVFNHKCMA